MLRNLISKYQEPTKYSPCTFYFQKLKDMQIISEVIVDRHKLVDTFHMPPQGVISDPLDDLCKP